MKTIYRLVIVLGVSIAFATTGCGDPDAEFRPKKPRTISPENNQGRQKDSGGFLPKAGQVVEEEKGLFED